MALWLCHDDKVIIIVVVVIVVVNYYLSVTRCLCEQGKTASRRTLLNFMMKNFNLGQNEKRVNLHLKLALKSGLEKGLLTQISGKGATGSVKLNKQSGTAGSVTAGPSIAAIAKKPKVTAAAVKTKATTSKAVSTNKIVKPKVVSLNNNAAKAKKPSLTKKSASRLVDKPKAAPKKALCKPKATKTKVVKPEVTKTVVGNVKKPAGRK